METNENKNEINQDKELKKEDVEQVSGGLREANQTGNMLDLENLEESNPQANIYRIIPIK